MYQMGDLTNIQPDDPKYDNLRQATEKAIEMESSTSRPVGIWDLDDGCNTLAIVFEGSVFK